MRRAQSLDPRHLSLPDPATIAVVGGGPAGCFFTISVLDRARQLGRQVQVLLLEKKPECRGCGEPGTAVYREGCNHCAGGISPRLIDVLHDAGIPLPEEIVAGQMRSLAIHGDWKSIELPVPEGRGMLAVFRGSRPKSRPDRQLTFDSHLLAQAVQKGAQVITAEVCRLEHGREGRAVVTFRAANAPGGREEQIEVDFVVVAAGVNSERGGGLEADSLLRCLRGIIPGFRPPQVRRTLICELQDKEETLRCLQGQVHFAQYGSRDLRIEMSSLIPKGRYLTVALIGPEVDAPHACSDRDLIERFMRLPHIQRLLPRSAAFTPACLCSPRMTVGTATRPFGERVAVIGDLAVSRLYKDGIYSAYLTASALAGAVLEDGIDAKSLRKAYWPVVRKLKIDNRYGELVFLISRFTFSRPVLSRILYQAVITERKSKPRERRRLADMLWQIASGDQPYRSIFFSMFHPLSIARIVSGGALVTARNYAIERLFGLKWESLGRYPTGVAREDVKAKRRETLGIARIELRGPTPEMERMYSIRIRAPQHGIWRELGRFGDDCEFFKPRMVRVVRTSGLANEVGSILEYVVALRCLGFRMVLETAIEDRLLVYRILDGFPRGGILVFDILPAERQTCLLSIYVAFDFPRGSGLIGKSMWRAFRALFPAFVHDVLWNQSLCKLKALVEEQEAHPR